MIKYSVEKLPDHLIDGLPQGRIRGFAELKTMLRLDKDVTTPIRDSTDVVHLVTSLTTDLLHACTADPPATKQGHSRYQVSGEPRKGT
jgi:hypothetical protein